MQLTRRDRGFTLLELMLALLLMAAILGVTWSLLGIFRNRLETSQRQTEQWQLIRSLQQLMATDLRGCWIPVKESSQGPDATAVALGLSTVNNGSAGNSNPSLSTSGVAIGDTAASNVRSGTSLSTDAVENTQPSNSPIDTQGLAGSLRGEADEIVVGGWLHPESFLLGTSQAMVLDTLPPTNPAGPQPPTEEPPLDDADIPDTVRRIVYVFNDRLTAARQDRPTGLVRCELTMRQLTALRQLRGGDADLLALLRPAIEELQQKSLDPLPTSASRDPRPADPSEAASVHQRLEALSDPSLFMGGEDLRLEEHLDYVPEVATFLLRYYDGQTWRSRWDSRVEGRLPVVVEIRFQLSAELKPLTSDHAEVQDEFDELLTAEENPLLSGESSTLEPIDERQQSAQARPPEDHRFLIFVRPVSSSDAVEADKAFGASSTVSSPQEGAIPSSPTPSSP